MGRLVGWYIGDITEAPLWHYFGDTVVLIGDEYMILTYGRYDSAEGIIEGSEWGEKIV